MKKYFCEHEKELDYDELLKKRKQIPLLAMMQLVEARPDIAYAINIELGRVEITEWKWLVWLSVKETEHSEIFDAPAILTFEKDGLMLCTARNLEDFPIPPSVPIPKEVPHYTLN